MSKKITDYLPRKERPQLVFIQGKIPLPLFEELRTELDQLGLGWNKYLVAVSERFIEEIQDERLRSGQQDTRTRRPPTR